MTVISSNTDAEQLTLDLVAEFDASPEQVWGVWEDPRKLERWWGPPGWPATFTRHEFEVGGESRYYMTGPEGDKHFGWWRIDVIDDHRHLEFANGFAGADGEPVPDLVPAGGIVELDSDGGRTRMLVRTQFVDVEQMERMIGMGMQEGMSMALTQIDTLLQGAAVA
jgi:uncharacterized protein YndB with AHSA1/START domain